MVLAHCGSLQLDPAVLMKVHILCLSCCLSLLSRVADKGRHSVPSASAGNCCNKDTRCCAGLTMSWMLHCLVAGCQRHCARRCTTSWWCWSACTGAPTSALEPAWRLSHGPHCACTELERALALLLHA